MTAKQSPSYYSATKMPNINEFLIFDPSIVDVYSCKSKCTTRNKDSPMTITNATTKKQNDSDPLISVASTESIRNCESKCANTENNNNKQNRTSTHIRVIGCRHLQKNRKIITESDSNESKRDEMSNIIDKDIKEKELGTSNYSIKVHILYLLVLLNLSILNSKK